MADQALYTAKRGGRDAWTGVWFEAATDLQQVLRDPRSAVADDRIEAFASREPIAWNGTRTSDTSTGDGAATG